MFDLKIKIFLIGFFKNWIYKSLNEILGKKLIENEKKKRKKI